MEDHAVLKAVIAAALVVDPAKRAPVKKILEIMREEWGRSDGGTARARSRSAGTRAQ